MGKGNLKFGNLRTYEGDNYVIPIEIVAEFDALALRIDSTEEGSDEWYQLVDVMINEYGKYKVEGVLYSMNIVIQ